MSDLLYPGASKLEGRTIREIVAVAMDAPAKAKSGHSGTAMALAPLGVMLWARILRGATGIDSSSVAVMRQSCSTHWRTNSVTP